MNKYDVIIVGSGPVGLAFALSLADSRLNILLLEKAELSTLESPTDDGREIALTHASVDILASIGVWESIDSSAVSLIKQAKVFNNKDKKPLTFSINDSKLEALGYLVANYLIRQALFKKVENTNNITIQASSAVNSISYGKDFNTVLLANGDSILTRLVVAADSRMSNMRSQANINANMHDFKKHMLVARMSHTKEHNNIALECFNYENTLALLPMIGNMSSMVLTLAKDDMDYVKSLSDTEFNDYISPKFDMGDMKLVGDRHYYPLLGVIADKFIGNRFALIGDSAVGMHPVTAHGFNLGLRGQNILAQEIIKANSVDMDIGNNFVLNQYNNKQINVARIMYFGTNSVVYLFTNNKTILKPLRSIALKLAQNLPPVHYFISKHLTQSSKVI